MKIDRKEINERKSWSEENQKMTKHSNKKEKNQYKKELKESPILRY